MKTKKLLGALLLLIFTVGFASCDDDNNPKYHLELSGNSCEVMQLSSVTIDLTAHENTTLDIKNPDLIDALYTWEFGDNKAKIVINGKQKGETDIVVTDHETGESATIKVKVTEYPLPRIAVEKSKGNIFDMMDFHIYTEGLESINTNNLSVLCDSIVWTVDGLNGSLRVFKHGEGEGWAGTHLKYKWAHCFVYPGEYKTYLTAWKDNKEIYQYQLDISIIDDNDFLVYNWSEITKNSQAWGTYVDVLGSSPDLMTTHGLNGAIPYAEVRLLGGNTSLNYKPLYNYFSELYSAPTYVDKIEKQNIWKLYRELFSEENKYANSAYPVAIWVTKRANIALLLLDESTEYPGIVVYAEPNRE